jgi:hypothetical protein
MSCRIIIAACALLLGGGACGGDPFEGISGHEEGGVGGDVGPRDSTLTDAGEAERDGTLRDSTPTDGGDIAHDATPRDATTVDARDADNDAGPRDATPPDVTSADSPETGAMVDVTLPSDSPDTGVMIDVTLPPDASGGDARQDVATEAAAPDADAGAMAWCAGRWALFCADFDTVTAVSDGWTTAGVTPGAVLDFNLVDFTSPRRSMHARVPAGSGGSEMASARLARVVSTSLARSILEFDCNVASIGAVPGDWLLQIGRLGRNGSESAVALLAQPMGTWSVLVTTNLPVNHGALPAPPKFGTFVRVSVDVLWSATAGSVTVAFDGVTVFARDGIATAVAATTSSVELTVGLLEAIAPTPPAELSVDNVVLR